MTVVINHKKKRIERGILQIVLQRYQVSLTSSIKQSCLRKVLNTSKMQVVSTKPIEMRDRDKVNTHNLQQIAFLNFNT